MIRAISGEIFLQNLKNRIPFRYGIAEMTAVPHLVLKLETLIDGQTAEGLAADSLPPHWFTKDPDTSYEEEIAAMLDVVQAAIDHATAVGERDSVFELWWALYEAQRGWAQAAGYPPLLWNFGVSLVERALIDASCRRHHLTFARAVHSDSLGFNPGRIHSELRGTHTADYLPARPAQCLLIRHTVGLSDPLREIDISSEERLSDGLPQSLEDNIHTYGLRAFKIKIQGDAEADLARLADIAAVLDAACSPEYFFTLDGNEQYQNVADFQDFWRRLESQAPPGFLNHLVVVEQPLHRSRALSPRTGEALLAWHERPPIIIDESDADLESLPRALQLGYAGTSHKNCKGIFKGLANACLLAHRQQEKPKHRLHLTGEDLANVGPIALLQDMAVMSVLGIDHVERNGHHYFKGLSAFPEEWQEEVLAEHPDVFHRAPGGFPTLDIHRGIVQIKSVLASPFGWRGSLETERLTPASDWRVQDLQGINQEDRVTPTMQST